MPKDGDVIDSYCNNCEHEATHVFHIGHLFGGQHWKCMGCGKRK